MNSPHEFAELAAALRRVQQDRFAGGAALATLVRTHGSAFRRAGARMLVLGDGSTVRGLSAGCAEADIVEHARIVIADGHARLLRHGHERGLDAPPATGCDSELEVLIEPLRSDGDLRFVTALEECRRARCAGWMATAFACENQCLEQPRRLVRSDHTLLDELDDPRLADALMSLAPEAVARDGAQVLKVGTRYGMFDVLVEPIEAPLRTVLVGVNATSRALARLAGALGWESWLVDHGDGAPSKVHPEGARIVVAEPGALLDGVACDRRTAIVIMTHDLERDLAYLRELRATPLAYLGALGSRSRAAHLHEASGAAATRLHAPAGLDIGSETPEEIALAIAAEIQAVLAGRRGGSLDASDLPIHGRTTAM
ncbi:XdhC family protein [Fontimonas sp. SYSU GA230001]|uniref:XdhC family protein n=1 Tax=Fontimonas sp. SYSU GA230001 TaxID=3142450 RepID=UPI0032B571A7